MLLELAKRELRIDPGIIVDRFLLRRPGATRPTPLPH